MTEQRATDDPGTTRMLTIAAVLVAVLAAVVAIGLTLRARQDTAPVIASTYPPGAAPASSPNRVVRTTVSPQWTNRFAPPPVPARRIGDDCSHDGLPAQWELRGGEWACLIAGAPGDHELGDDCSHDDVPAEWAVAPDGRWVCLPRQ
ncbi:hypothetical protein [Nocardia panacis]|nr:hypothetical protein [Nocardia panacis]